MTENISDLTDCVRQVMRHLFTFHRLALPGYCLLALPVVLLLTACDGKPEKQTAPPRPVRTITAPVAAGTGLLIRTGEIRPQDEVALGFRLDGRLLMRAVDVGDSVTAGQLLGTLESDTQQNQFESARADFTSALATERLAALNLKRMIQLMPSGAIARVQLDTARSDWQTAASRRQSSEAALKTAQENLSWTRLTAPAAGVVTQVSAQPGQVLMAGQPLVTLAVSGGRDAVIDVVDPQQFSRHTGVFIISLTRDPVVKCTGELRNISPQADPQTRTWRVRIHLIDPPVSMMLGASVQVRQAASGPGLISLPASALTWTGGKPAVFVVNRLSHQLELRPVTLGGYTTSAILVSTGVVSGDAVVTAGVNQLRQGETVAFGEAAE
ncbi:efflux RND transporter periplasmic adaptor subunit [Tatumella citrea]|uniref:Efflux transporter periplasmic adaptor subunit n=1 Tax=Tatumella citrea TaxID=53336 RepID=A0A1Y0LCR2_TATCI|nr:efflux RND transporter periplasmic adaptor subunit [Tatumella citrea]ARU95460.1 efflux transporter periplasmic adaptor subunit [Tatumella citrea]ARU99501.1 efflux transporter periplasmic adaptor subunit [Tatumella citrea]